MATKWKKFSFGVPVRIILNVLLVFSLIVGNVSIQKLVSLQRKKVHNYNEMDYSGVMVNDNEELQQEIKDTLQTVLFYVGELSRIDEKEEREKCEKEYKRLLQETRERYKYYVSYKEDEGKKEVSFTNIEDATGNMVSLGQKSVLISYSGVREKQGYSKDWKNVYLGNLYNFTWLQVNSLINENCYQNENRCFYIAKEIANNIQHYKNNQDIMLALIDGQNNGVISEEIIETIYGNFEDVWYTDYYDTEKQSYEMYEEISQDTEGKKEEIHLSDKEKEQLIQYLKKILYLDLQEERINIPISSLLGTPASYRVFLTIDEEYVQSLQVQYEQKCSNLQEYVEINAPLENEWKIWVIDSWMVIFVLVLLLLCVCGRKYGTEQIQYLAVDRFPTEIIFLFETISISLFFIFIDVMEEWEGNVEHIFAELSFLACLVLSSWFVIQCFFSIARKFKGKILFQSSICGKIFLKTREKTKELCSDVIYSGNKMKKIIAVLVGNSILCGIMILGVIDCANSGDNALYIWLFALLINWGLRQIWWFRYLLSIEKIEKGIEEVKEGKLTNTIPLPPKYIPLKGFVNDLNSLSDGLNHAANEMVKSERLKTELISNVSHDIKTPLTSIITYVDLLKKEELKPEKAKEYVDVIEQKAQRLKALTDNLFEAAKASSGAMNTEFSEIDFGALILQAIGEFSEKFENNELDVRNKIEESSYTVYADGRLAWRIIENIFTNVAKYALVGSRVYMDVKEEEHEVMFVVKNISACELNISAEELMERFTRGERSRNTEGSGLGLNIAKSLAELQGGSFYVEIDGDLFKSVLILPKYKSNMKKRISK